MTTRTGLTVLRLVLGLVTGSYSLALILTQIRGDTHHALLMLGIAEMAAAILFLIPRTMWFGGIGLMVVFAVAALFHVLHGDYNIGNLAVYAAAAFTVLCKPRQV